MEKISNTSTPQICRACLESSEKLYPLVGTVINVDVNIATMISYCISKELDLNEDLPNGVCVPCFKIIRIAYNFLRQFKESEERLLKKTVNQQGEHFNNFVCEEEAVLNKGKPNIIESGNECDDNSDINKTDLIKYNLETFHNYAERCDSQAQDIVDVHSEDANLDFVNHQMTVRDVSESETEDYSSSLIEYVEVSDEVDVVSEDVEVLDNPSLNVVKEYLIWDESASETVSAENKSLIKSEFIQRDDARSLSGCEFTCPICNLKFHRLQKFNDHVVSHDIDMIVCNKCPVPVELNIFQYIQHYKELHRYQCNICNRSLTSSYGFRYHMKQHENVRKYACPIKNCKKSFFLLHLLKKHMRTHSNTIKYICNLCGANFRTYDTYRYHQKTHDGKRNHLCTECGQAFFQAVHLRDHMFRHTGYKHFTCDMCGNSFTTNSQLKKHLNHCRKFKEK